MPYGKYQNLPLTDRLMMMLEATQAGTWEWNVQTGECYFNERWAEIIGYTLDELKPHSIETWIEYVHAEDGQVSDKILNEHFDGKRSFYECEARMRHKDGHWVWVRDYGKLVSRTADGKPEWVVGTHIDISGLKELSQRFEAFADLLPGVVYQYEQHPDGSSCFPFASQGMKHIYGVSPDAVKHDASPVFKVIHPDDLPRVAKTITESAERGVDWICEYRVIHSGKTRWVFGHARPQSGIDESTLWYGMIIDITDRKKLELELEKSQANLKLAQRIARTGHWEANMESGELYWSDMVYEILGYERGELEPSVELFRNLVPDEDMTSVARSEERAQKTGVHDVQHRMTTRDGSLIWVHELAELQSDGITLIGTVRDITEQKNLELKLQQQAVIDPLTQIGNRRAFNKAMDREFSRYSRHKKPLSLISFDLDHFKRVNDNYGHAAGDKVLSEVTAAIKVELRKEDVFARVGGEEFAVLLPETDKEEAFQVAEKIRTLIASLSINYENQDIAISATFGLVTVSEQEQISSQEHLLQIADRALYKGKTNGRNQVVVADKSLFESTGK
ncbi:hypothetical protein CWC33_05200 [Idiomarina sp. X4]|uniref:GGDEF domain-containing protein n=1 Tax=unclassified Idiomarina TaxID=2614829 RepID=UPI000C29362B|nr:MULTISPECIES: sensor domain-containing diguanylate cyclase [unclassified Idiomarina]ATZ73131.1 hypothetical protein CWC33_05200 [Idiomarina sp. X4]MCJ8317882.1 diguanylate cyclase [Idiomarina sp.]NQZ17405.1 diguanylate cyclase [Idiomarina sp.]